MFLIQSLPVTFHRDEHRDDGEESDRPELWRDACDSVAFQENAANDAHEVSQRQHFSKRLRPAWHSAEGKGESGEQQRRQKEKESHLHGLQLVLRNRGERDSDREVRDNEKSSRSQQ